MLNIAAALSELRKLSPEERYEIAMTLLDELPEGEAPVPFTEEHKAIIDERLARMERDPTPGTPWEDFKREIEERYGR